MSRSTTPDEGLDEGFGPERLQRLEAALHESEQRYRVIVENAAEGIWTIDDKGATTFVNPAMALMLGYDRVEMLGRPMYDFMDEAAREEARQNMNRRRMGVRERHPFRLRHKLGQAVWTSMSSCPLLDADGRFVGALALVTDETSRLHAAEQQKLQEHELLRLDKMTSLSALVAGVIHEINNPNHFITLNGSLLRKVFQDVVAILDTHVAEQPDLTLAGLPYLEMREEVPRMLDQILLGAERIRHIGNELRTYVNSQAPGPFRAVGMNDIVVSAVTLLEGRIRRCTDHFTQALGQNLPVISADPPRLVQVVVNVLLNALEALTDRSQSVELETRHDEAANLVELVVRDHGVGIDAAALGKVRTPFFTTKRAQGGLGLGLAVAERVLSEHRATLAMTSTPGKGTEVRVQLPVASRDYTPS